jgi:hypothetical protein
MLAGAGALAVAGAHAATLSPATGLSGDIRILRRAYETMHPGLYRYATPAQMNRGFDELEATWAKAPSQRDLYLSLSRFLARVQCGHTYANFYNQKKDVATTLFAGPDKLPFHFRWLGGRMIVTATGGEDLPPKMHAEHACRGETDCQDQRRPRNRQGQARTAEGVHQGVCGIVGVEDRETDHGGE